ncbi:MAG: hypothetical protein ACK5OC_01870 [Pirellula sp.]|jgi:hypothetical protein
MLSLFTTFYTDKSPVRQKELEYCLSNNLENELIDRVCILTESPDCLPFDNAKIKLIKTNNRPFFKELVEASNLMNSCSDMSIIANSDIHFDKSLSSLSEFEMDKTVLCLNRWDVLSNGNLRPFNSFFSSDTWVFQGEIKVRLSENYHLGQPACDNRFNYDLFKSNYQILNPAFTIRTFHVHASEIRSYTEITSSVKSVSRPYFFVPLDYTMQDRMQKPNIRAQLKRLYHYNRFTLNRQILLNRLKAEDYHPYSSSRLAALMRCLWHFNYLRKKSDFEFSPGSFA